MGDHLPGLGQCDPYTMPEDHHSRRARVAPSSATTPLGERVPDVWVGGSYPASGDLAGLPGVPAEAGTSKASYPHRGVMGARCGPRRRVAVANIRGGQGLRWLQ